MSDKTNKLTQDELDAVALWASGKTMTEAYCEVMRRNDVDISKLPKQTLNKRVQRFFNSEKMKKAMLVTGQGRDERIKRAAARQKAIDTYGRVLKNVKPKIKKAVAAEEEKENKAREKEVAKEGRSIASFVDNIVLPNVTKDNANSANPTSRIEEVTNTHDIKDINIANKQAREKWLESLTITEEPEAISVFGTGQFIMYHAVSEIMRRDRAIKEKRYGTGVFDKNGTVFTPLILNAFKTAASMIIPFTTTQDAVQNKEITMATTLLGLMQDKIQEDPDDYTAPIPPTVTIDVTKEDSEDSKEDENED